MNLPQLISQSDSNSYYSRSDADLYSAANSAGWALFTAVMREHRGFFVKFDTTSIALVPGTSTYQLPPDFTQLIHFSERISTSEPYHPLGVTTIGAALDYAQSQVGWGDYWQDGYYGGPSPFSFDGPYLVAPSSAVPNAPQIYQMDIAPAIDTARMTELVYIAKWLPVTDDSSVVMLPDEAYPAWLSLTTANLLDMNDDSMAATYRNRALNYEVPLLLSWARQRQISQKPRISMFGG